MSVAKPGYSHILEHLSLQDFKTAIENTYKILRDDGIFRLVLPDLEYAIKNYIDDPSVSAAYNFLHETSLGRKTRNRGLFGLVKDYLGNSQHFWMWDYKSLANELKSAGFSIYKKS